MPNYPLIFTITNPHSKVPITGKVQDVNYPIILETICIEDLFDVDNILEISVTVE